MLLPSFASDFLVELTVKFSACSQSLFGLFIFLRAVCRQVGSFSPSFSGAGMFLRFLPSCGVGYCPLVGVVVPRLRSVRAEILLFALLFRVTICVNINYVSV